MWSWHSGQETSPVSWRQEGEGGPTVWADQRPQTPSKRWGLSHGQPVCMVIIFIWVNKASIITTNYYCFLLTGEHVSILCGDTWKNHGVCCSQRWMCGLGGKTVSQHISGEQETNISVLIITQISTLINVQTAGSSISVFSPFIALSQRGGTSRSTQHHVEENQIYASADEGKSAHMVLSSPPVSSFYISWFLHPFR